MAIQLLITVIIAVLWMFLQETYTMQTFVVGIIFAVVLLVMLRRFVPGRLYFITIWRFLKLVLVFSKELLIANWDVVKAVYSPRMNTKPGIFRVHTELRSKWQITLLANLISLTPGTLSLVVSDDRTVLYIHAMDIHSTEESAHNIKNTFEKLIMELTE
ncbi:Na+/H+ antiporter subunit E [Aureibacillus halotolerans]|uniref:Multisubunit sodium/proton antiporter MrpE subunit n=1 Tax=Aureibacillus halotolerans TaxID=1508390 RepID=A0A4R6U4S2_9BACI|nr:Na+/H+ antiporter subunit E [Aureibacillus halotolerans]TDQ38024.1 multisubunit sodium/proton antiporter MrpE subunit [Aureibacillus halotolerans]